MDDEEFLKSFVGVSSEKKIQRYEAKIVRRLLRKWGVSASRLRGFETLGNDNGWSWILNEQLDCPFKFHITRLFNFNLLSIIQGPKRHPLWDVIRFHKENYPNPHRRVVIFHVNAFSEWAAFSEPEIVTSDFYNHIRDGLFTYIDREPIRIVPLKQFEDFFIPQWQVPGEY